MKIKAEINKLMKANTTGNTTKYVKILLSIKITLPITDNLSRLQ